MTTTINASPSNGLVQTADGSGILKVQSNGVTTNSSAWLSYSGSTSSILSSYNISSVTRNGVGDYTINFTTSMPNANYAVVGSSGSGTGYANGYFFETADQVTARTTSLFRCYTFNLAGANNDSPFVAISVYAV